MLGLLIVLQRRYYYYLIKAIGIHGTQGIPSGHYRIYCFRLRYSMNYRCSLYLYFLSTESLLITNYF